jgi:hypothetical protein
MQLMELHRRSFLLALALPAMPWRRVRLRPTCTG